LVLEERLYYDARSEKHQIVYEAVQTAHCIHKLLVQWTPTPKTGPILLLLDILVKYNLWIFIWNQIASKAPGFAVISEHNWPYCAAWRDITSLC